MTREEIRANIIDTTIDAILSAYWEDTIELEAFEQDLDNLLREHVIVTFHSRALQVTVDELG